MKKKFINGILMVAMLFAATTSFVSCKDNVDDFAVDIYATIEQVRANLQSQLDGLESRISSLEGRMSSAEGEIKNLWTETQRLQGEIDALDVKLNNLQDRVDAIEGRLDEIEKRIAALEESFNELITDINVRETNNPVVGTINLPALHANFLAAYYAEILTDIDAFPYETQWVDGEGWTVTGVTVDPNGNRLRKSDIANWVQRISFDRKKHPLVTNFEGNAGKLYFSLNPIGVNTDNVTFSLINSQGVESPVELTYVKKSAHQLTWAIGKHGNGTSLNEADPSDYLYEATATIPITRIQENNFPWQNVIKQLTLGSDAKAIIEDLKTNGAKKSILKSAYELVQNFYQAELDARKNMVYWNLKAEKTLTDGSTKEYVDFSQDISIATVRPLSYNFFWGLRDNLKAYVDAEDIAAFAGAILKLAGVSGKEFSKIEKVTFDASSITGDYVYIITTDNGEFTGTLADISATISASGMNIITLQTILDEIANGNNKMIDVLNEYIADINKVTNITSGDLTDKVSNYLNKFANKLTTELGDNYTYRAVAPILLYNSPDGVKRLLPGATLKQEYPTSTFFMTSPTEEYLVPAMLKYIAVLKGGKVLEAYVEAGWNKVQDLDLPEGDIEIIYQTVDFNGFVITKRYPITVVK